MVYNIISDMIPILLDATDTLYKLQDIIDNDDEMAIMWGSDVKKSTKCLEDCVYILQDMLLIIGRKIVMATDTKPIDDMYSGANVPVVVAAKIMHKGPMFIRIGLQRGILPFGVAIKKDENGIQYDYYITRRDLRCSRTVSEYKIPHYNFIK